MAVPSGEGSAPIVSALEVLEADEVMIVTARGKVTRGAADAVPVQGRRTQGKQMADVEPGDRVVEVTRAQGRGGVPARDSVVAAGDDQQEQELDQQELDLLGVMHPKNADGGT